MKKFFLYDYPLKSDGQALLNLFLRLFIGALMLTHGLAKIMAYRELSAVFWDPIGIGSQVSLVLSIIAEVGCSVLLIFGIFTRLAVLPLLVNMLVAVFVVHGSDAFAVRELAVLYLGVYLVIFFWGGGRYSVDNLLFRKKKYP